MTLPALMCGYLRRLPGVDDQAEQRLMADMIALAEREGFTLTLVFIEKEPGRTAALEVMARYCQRHEVRHVVAPASEHLNTLPALAVVSKELLQEEIGGQVWIVAPTDEETLCPPTT